MDPEHPAGHRSPKACTHLIVVCGHAIWLGGPTQGRDESEWVLEPFQLGETATLLKHIEAGVEEYFHDPKALLIFSGGATKQHITHQSEGSSYLAVAIAQYPSLSRECLMSESLATDSFQNVLLSLLLFVRKTGHAPNHLTIISHDFKRTRFMEQHLPTLQWPLDRTTYIGIDPPTMQAVKGCILVKKGEARAIQLWKEDPWGWGDELGGKRRRRGWRDLDEGSEQADDWETWRTLVKWKGVPQQEIPHTLPWLEVDDAKEHNRYL